MAGKNEEKEIPKKVEEPKGESMSAKLEQKRFKTEMRVEAASPAAHVHPRILAGVCEKDGLPVFPGRTDLKGKTISVSPYYDGVDVTCTYCAAPPETLMKRTINVYSLAESPDVLIMCCDDYRCQSTHQKRFMGNKVESTR